MLTYIPHADNAKTDDVKYDVVFVNDAIYIATTCYRSLLNLSK